MPLILADLNIKSTIYIPNNELILSLFQDNAINYNELSKTIYELEETYDAFCFYFKAFQQVLTEKDKIKVDYGRLILNEHINYNRVILANVIAEDYYKLVGDRTNHIVTLIPKNNRYIIIDPYKKMGYTEFDNWDECLDNTKRYDWSNFNGIAVVL